MKKRILALLLCLCLVPLGMPLGAAAEALSGSITWQLEDGALTLSGSGALDQLPAEVLAVKGQVKTVEVQPGITSLGERCFEGFEALTAVSLPEGLTALGAHAFQDCVNVTSLSLPSSLRNIGDAAFGRCIALPSLVIPEGVASLGRDMFSGCENMTSLTLPESLTSLGDYVFFWCWKLNAVRIPANVSHIGENALTNCGLHSISYGGTLEELAAAGLDPKDHPDIGFRFEGGLDWQLTDGTLTISTPGYLGGLPDELLSRKEEIKHVVVGPGVTSIGGRCFEGLEALESVQLPEGLTSLGEHAFQDCVNLASLNLPSTLTDIGMAAFGRCIVLPSIAIPKGVTSLGKDMFSGCEYLVDLTLPESLTSLGDFVFFWCPRLGKVRIPAAVKEISEKALEGCSLTSITYGGSYEELVQAGVDPKDHPDITFHFEGDPVYTVTFDPNGGTVETATKSVSLHEAYGALPAPAHPEHRGFLGWYTQPEGGKLVVPTDPLTVIADHTLYARWSDKNASPLQPVEEDAKPEKLQQASNADSLRDSTIRSHLYENHNGGLTRVQYGREDSEGESDVLVEEYDGEFNLTASLHIKPELPIWGGFYCGELYNFLFFGQPNPQEDDNAEVIRVVRYDKLWNRIDHASLRGANTVSPFHSLRCAESGGYLFVHTAHSMYKSGDGLNHQANLTFALDEAAMEITDSYYSISNSGWGYVSHSFNQFILINQEGRMVTLDHGDAYPRGILLCDYTGADLSRGKFSSPTTNFEIQHFPGETGDNYTGANIGGFVETETGYFTAYNYDGDSDSSKDGLEQRKRDIYYCYIDKETLSGEPVRLTTSKNASVPILIPTGPEGGFLLWNIREGRVMTDVLCYARYTADGKVGEIKRTTGRLSDCDPVYHDGKYTWYTTTNSERDILTFYSLDKEGNITTKEFKKPLEPSQEPVYFWDVWDGLWYADAVQYVARRGIMTGTNGGTTFEPNTQTTRAMIVQMLYQMEGKPPVPAPSFQDVPAGRWYSSAVSWAAQNGVVSGYADNRFGPDDRVTREQLTVMLYSYARYKDAELSASADLSRFPDGGAVSSWARTAMEWAVAGNLVGGKNVGGTAMLDPRGRATRAEIAQIFMNFCEKYL